MRGVSGLFCIAVFVGLCCSVSCLANPLTDPTSLFGRLLKGERFFGDHLRSNSLESQSLAFTSTGLPDPCRTGDQREDLVWVSLVSKKNGMGALIQIIGGRPRVLSSECVFWLVDDIRRSEPDGIRMIAGNLNRMQAGGLLFLEFSVEGAQSPQLRKAIQSLIEEGSVSDQRGRFMGRHRLAAVLLMIVCLIVMIWGIGLVLDERRSMVHVE